MNPKRDLNQELFGNAIASVPVVSETSQRSQPERTR